MNFVHDIILFLSDLSDLPEIYLRNPHSIRFHQKKFKLGKQYGKNQGVKNFTLVARQDCCTLTMHGSHTLI